MCVGSRSQFRLNLRENSSVSIEEPLCVFSPFLWGAEYNDVLIGSTIKCWMLSQLGDQLYESLCTGVSIRQLFISVCSCTFLQQLPS